MKSILKKALFFASTTLFLVPAGLHAQSQNVLFGRTNITLDSSFLATMQNANSSIALLDGTALANGTANFSVITGSLNTDTAAGELFHSGGYLLSVGGNAVRLQNFDIDTTNTAAPVISALLIVNGNLVGRITAFSELGNGFSLVKLSGSAQLTGINLYLSSALASNLNSLLGQQTFTAGQLVGTDTQNIFFASTPTGSN